MEKGWEVHPQVGCARTRIDLAVVEPNVVLFILRQQISAPEVGLVRVTGRLLGFQRPGDRVDSRMREGIERLMGQGQPDATGRRSPCRPVSARPS